MSKRSGNVVKRNTLERNALVKSNSIIERIMCVMPHPGHFNPVTVLKKHGIQKDVYRTMME